MKRLGILFMTLCLLLLMVTLFIPTMVAAAPWDIQAEPVAVTALVDNTELMGISLLSMDYNSLAVAMPGLILFVALGTILVLNVTAGARPCLRNIDGLRAKGGRILKVLGVRYPLKFLIGGSPA